MALHLFSAFLSWIDLVCVCLCKGNLEKHGGICLMVAFHDKFQECFSVLFCDDLNVFWTDWEEWVFGHYKVAPNARWVDSENDFFDLSCFDFDTGLVELDPIDEAMTPQALFFDLLWFVSEFHLCLLLCRYISVFPTVVAPFTRRKV